MLSFNKVVFNKRLLTSFISLIVILVSWIAYFSLTSFSYTDEMLEAANNLASRKIINDHGDDPSKYNLWSKVLRQEIATVSRWLASIDKSNLCKNIFSDVTINKPNSWACFSIEPLVENDIITKNDKFRPEDQITKAEALWMLVKSIWFDYSYDSSSSLSWQEQIVDYWVKLWAIEDFSDYNKDALRGWVFETAYNLIKIDEWIWDVECMQVETYAINPISWECVSFPNSCIPKDWQKIDTCEGKQLNYKKDSFEIVFDKDMDRESVEENIKIYPVTENKLIWEDNKKLKVELSESPDKETEFIVNVWENAKYESWDNIEDTIVKKFKVSWVAKVDFITPEWEITDLTKNITVRFSKPIVALANFDNQENCPIEITPEIKWKCVWITTSTFQFRPENWFPIWANYTVHIPSWIDTISSDKTVNSKTVNIVTPKFDILKSPKVLNKDDKLNIAFNSDISIDNFKENFEISTFDNSDLDISYFEYENSYGEKEFSKSIVSVFPKSWDWGYAKTYNYKLKSWLKSERWNVSIWTDSNISLQINKLLTDYNPFEYKKTWIENENLVSNFRKSQADNIVTKNYPNILLTFNEEINLDKNIIEVASYDYNLKYAKNIKYIDWKQEIYENKKQIIVEISWKDISSINLNILASKISNSDDINLKFYTKDYNKIISYKMLNYKTACLETKNPISLDRDNYDFIDYWDDSKVSYINQVYSYSDYVGCSFEKWKNKYILNTMLNPDSDYNLEIKQSFFDSDNYPLDKDYSFSFHTNKALNEDKGVSVLDSRDMILVPKDISPLWISIRTINLDKVFAEVCQWDFDLTNIDYIKNSHCETKEIDVNNLWFDTNISVLNIESILWEDITKPIVTLKVSKLDQDKTEYEKTNKKSYYYKNDKVHYIFSDNSAVLKTSWAESSLWLTNFKTWESLDNMIKNISLYQKERKYSKFGDYEWEYMNFSTNINFSFVWDWLYDLNTNLSSGYLLIDLINWEQIILSVWYVNWSNDQWKIYLSTDAPLYKPWSKVKIKWTTRVLKSTSYEIWSYASITIRDSNYKNILDQKELKVNKNGSFEFEFDLDKEASLWNYQIEVVWTSWYSYLTFSVEEYEKPDFKVDSKVKKDVYYYGEIPQLEIKSDYYVWSPLLNWQWNYSIYASDYHFDWWKTSWYIWWENNSYYWWWNYYNSYSNPVSSNNSFILDKDWKAILDIDTSNTVSDKIYNVSTMITDPNTKKSISSSSSFKLLNSDTFVWIKFDKYYYNFWDSSKIDFITTDIDWSKLWSRDIKFKVYKVNYNYDETTYNYIKDEKLLQEKDLSTNSSWVWVANYTFEDYWEYKLEFMLANWKYKTTKTLYISWYNLLRPEDEKHNLIILNDKEKYNIWDNAEIIIQSPITWVKALVSIEKMWKILHKEIIDINSNSQVYNFKIKKEYLPNVQFKAFIIENTLSNDSSYKKLEDIRNQMLEIEQEIYKSKWDDFIIPYYYIYSDLLIKDGIWYPIYNKDNSIDKTLLEKLAKLRTQEQNLMKDLLPWYYFWQADIKLNLDSIILDTNVSIDKVSYLPSDSQEITLNIKDSNWNPVSWEAMISIVDESLLALKDNDIDIVNYFYSDTYNNNYLYYNLSDLIKRFDFDEYEKRKELLKIEKEDFWYSADMALWWIWFDDELSEWASMKNAVADSIVAESPMDKSVSNSTKLRTDFKDVAFYKWIVDIVNWKAIIKVSKLPDNLTTWIIKGYTITPDTKVWAFEKDFKVQKKLNLLPSIPRFFVVWDEVEIWAVVVNNTTSDLDVKFSLELDNIDIIWDKTQTKQIKANSQDLVSFKVKVKNKPENIDRNQFKTTILLKAESWDLVDSLQLEKNIIAYSTPEYVFTNWSTNDLSYEEKIFLPNYVDKDLGQLDINLWATILTNLLDSIENIASSPNIYFYNTISAMKKASSLKWLYKAAWEESSYYDIEVIDYLWNKVNLHKLILERMADIAKYQNSDWWMMYRSDCASRYNYSCSSFWLTWEFLATAKKMKKNWYDIDETIVKKALKYYEKELESEVKKYETNWYKYRNIDPFYKIIWYDNEFLKKYVIDERFIESWDFRFDNISKLKLIIILQKISKDNLLLDIYIDDIKNSTLIEARWTLVPANNWSRNNIVSTSLALRMFINDLSSEKLIIENMARWLLQQKNEAGDFWSSYETSEVIDTISSYILYTKELENVDFSAKWFLNSKEVIEAVFDKNNKFENISESYSLKDYINFWEYNSLWFEKTWSWKLYYDIWLKYYLPIEQIEARDEWIIINRSYYDYEEYKNTFKEDCSYRYLWFYDYYWWYSSYYYPCIKKKIKNISEVSYGNKWDYLVWEIEITIPYERNDVIVNNFIPSWAELININLNTTSEDIKNITWQDSSWWWWFDYVENKNDRVVLYADKLYKWTYKYTYVIQLNHKWIYHNRPAVAEELKKPEIWGRTKWEFFEIK